MLVTVSVVIKFASRKGTDEPQQKVHSIPDFLVNVKYYFNNLKNMSYCEDLNLARKQLFESLGNNAKKYCQLMKLWFSMKLTKEEFDSEARRMMNPDQAHLHNVFLLCLFNKCSGLSKATSKAKLKDFKKLKLNKAKRSSDKGTFQLADPVNYLPQLESPPQHLQDEPQRYCVQELFLPDQSLILGRLMLTSWEMGMEGAEDSAAEILVHAVQYFLKNLLTVILSQRNGYKLREKKMICSLGCPVPNPWLRSYHGLVDDSLDSKMTDVIDDKEDSCHVPKMPLTYEELERREMYQLACASTNSQPRAKPPVSAYEVFQALQVHKSTIPSHSMYAINMDKIICAFNHPSHEEIEAAKYFVNS